MGSSRWGGGGGQSGCERRSEVFVKHLGWGSGRSGSGGGSSRLWGQGGCERRNEVLCEKWKLKVNTDKTKVLIFNKSGRLMKKHTQNFVSFYYG